MSASARSSANADLKLTPLDGAPNMVDVGWPVLIAIEPVRLVAVIDAVAPLVVPLSPVELTTRAYWPLFTVTFPPLKRTVPPTYSAVGAHVPDAV